MKLAMAATRVPETAVEGVVASSAAATAETKSMARSGRAADGFVGRRPELVAPGGIVQQTLRLVPARQTSDEHAVADQLGAAGGKPFAGDALRDHQARRRAIVGEAEERGSHALPETTEERRVRRVERRR